ncbi:MAG: hypothetical protein EOS26_07920 [Mesorhizobium sp.]|nr:MAG: hypothetical protein EOQ41_00850 [Mesorhizobium sp.]RWC40735.1 MAG: hypothetical protein EOS28_22615 [Mesorhizobium sp.]RWF77692.1 MAG: hypothetical protein EOS26_07920 [Mesorhizobium sp.]
MQVFGLPRHVIRAGALASRIAAKSLSNEAAIRMDAVRRWQSARAAGLSAGDAAKAMQFHLDEISRHVAKARMQCCSWIALDGTQRQISMCRRTSRRSSFRRDPPK